MSFLIYPFIDEGGWGAGGAAGQVHGAEHPGGPPRGGGGYT